MSNEERKVPVPENVSRSGYHSADMGYKSQGVPNSNKLTTIIQESPDSYEEDGNLLENIPKVPKPSPVHKRTVSWGLNNVHMLQNDTSNNFNNNNGRFSQQPDLRNISPDTLQLLAEHKKRQIARGEDEKLEIQEVAKAHPMQSNSEESILKSAERYDPLGSNRFLQATSSRILNNVPDNIVDAFRENQNSNHDMELRPTSTGDSEREGFSNRSNKPDNAEVNNKPQKQTKRRQHRRELTMEERLVGLTDAINAVHNLHNDNMNGNGGGGLDQSRHSNLTPGHHRHTSTLDSNGLDEINYINDPIGSADAFNLNASFIYRRRKETDGHNPFESPLDKSSSTHGSGMNDNNNKSSTALDHWRNLRNVMKAGMASDTKKSDGDPIDEEGTDPEKSDPELGEVTGEQTDEMSNTEMGRRRPRLSESHLKKDIDDFVNRFKKSILLFLKIVVMYLMVPSIGVACILFYLTGNPPVGILANGGKPINGTLYNTDGEAVDPAVASASWWILFICVRQAFTFTLAKALELIMIDILSIRTGFTLRVCGSWITLLLLQSKGWPFILFAWGLMDFLLLSGSKPFFEHWGYWQAWVDIFNQANPSGDVIDSDWNHKILAIAVCLGFVVALKRTLLGLYLGRRTFDRYSDQLANIMHKILLVSEVASLARDIERYAVRYGMKHLQHLPTVSGLGIVGERMNELIQEDDSSADGMTMYTSEETGDDRAHVIDPEDRHPLTGSLSATQKQKITKLLGAWEEPRVAEKNFENVSVSAILEFRRALACLNTEFPFSTSFGSARTRYEMIENGQEVFRRLMLRTPEDKELCFDVLSLLALNPDHSLDQSKVKELIRIFRPDRNGMMDAVDFVKSIDAVYRDLRMLRAAVTNGSKIDKAFEDILNIAFYAVAFTVILSRLGFDPLALFLSISGIILGFAFMISSASSKYFEGLLFILVRRPYDIGDCIHVSNVESDTAASGAAWWMVEDVNLFTTSVIFNFTNERATLSNGSLANSRVINSSRSEPAYLYVMVQFPINVPHEKVDIFHKALEEYIRNRPREWLTLLCFRAMRVEAAKGFIEYMALAQHRDTWDSWLGIQICKGKLATFVNELAKTLDIQYKNPPLPVEITATSTPNLSNFHGNFPSSPSSDSNTNGGSHSYSNDLSTLMAKWKPENPGRR